MRTLAVDLAARFSAACVTQDGEVLHEFGSADLSAFGLGDATREAALAFNVDRIIIEDIPPHVKFGVKNILRLQGLMILALGRDGHKDTDLLDKTLFVQPRPWQNHYPGVSRGAEADRIEAARVAAEKIGYAPPPLVEQYLASVPEGKRALKGKTDNFAKQMTDFIDARLICDWADQFESLEAIEAQVKNQCTRPYI
jgi:hypothetical protein